MINLQAGTLAYYDTFSGLIPCRVLQIEDRQKDDKPGMIHFNLTRSGGASTRYNVRFVLTAARGAYRRGETLTDSSLHIIPRDAVRCMRSRICTPRILAYGVTP